MIHAHISHFPGFIYRYKIETPIFFNIINTCVFLNSGIIFLSLNSSFELWNICNETTVGIPNSNTTKTFDKVKNLHFKTFYELFINRWIFLLAHSNKIQTRKSSILISRTTCMTKTRCMDTVLHCSYSKTKKSQKSGS